MSKLFARIAGFFSNRTFVGVDNAGNRYFTRKEEIDGILKEKRWVEFKGEQDPTSIPVELAAKDSSYSREAFWYRSPLVTSVSSKVSRWNDFNSDLTVYCFYLQEIMELEARRERVRLNVARVKVFKKEEEERKAREGIKKAVSSGKVGGPDLKSFIRQFPSASEGNKVEQASDGRTKEAQEEKRKPLPESSEPTGSGASYKPGTWQPPT
ncbi:hypothetical protein CRYUN_Cryun39dG0019700 [Craigia yunnanensis]